MKKFFAVALLGMVAALAGCGTRSISDSGYDGGRGERHSRDNGFAYQGELSEFDVLGIERGAKPTDEEIQRTLASRKALVLKRGARVMLLQSGAIIPDSGMTAAISKYFSVGVFSGQPMVVSQQASGGDITPESYSRSLRLAAARGGHETLVVYWGLLESARENLATSSVSWVPVVGWVLPDEKQRMRIRLKVAVIDVATGQWEMFSPDAIEDKDTSSIVSRRNVDQTLVNALKEKAYVATAEDLVKRFSR
jgi:hypothetical protein